MFCLKYQETVYWRVLEQIFFFVVAALKLIFSFLFVDMVGLFWFHSELGAVLFVYILSIIAPTVWGLEIRLHGGLSCFRDLHIKVLQFVNLGRPDKNVNKCSLKRRRRFVNKHLPVAPLFDHRLFDSSRVVLDIDAHFFGDLDAVLFGD